MSRSSLGPVLLILLDAFRWDYLSEGGTPFLFEASRRGLHVRQLTPSFGFCERAEMLTGAPPERTGYFTAIGYDPDASPLRGLARGLSSLEIVQDSWVDRVFRRALRVSLRFLGIRSPIYRIPFDLLGRVVFTEDAREHRDPDGLAVDSLVQSIDAVGGTIYWDSFTALGMFNGDDRDRIDRLMRAPTHHSLYLLYLGAIDAWGHTAGPGSEELRAGCAEVDGRLKMVAQHFLDLHPGGSVVIVGDHGMTSVDRIVNAEEEIRAWSQTHDFVVGRDFQYFLDSTLIRIWTHNRRCEALLPDLFGRTPLDWNGELRDVTGADLKGRSWASLYGDVIWSADPGCLVFPNFFQRDRPVAGMHGYPPDDESMFGMLTAVGTGIPRRTVQRASLIDVCPTLCELLEVDTPKANEGRSLLSE